MFSRKINPQPTFGKSSPSLRAGALLLSLSLLGPWACAPYRAEVVQGNVVTKEMIARLKVGMDKDTVLRTMGTPLLTSVFHSDRWDYVFMLDRQGAAPQRRHVTLFFKTEKLDHTEGAENLPSEKEFLASIDEKR